MPSREPDHFPILPQRPWRDSRKPWSPRPAPVPGELMSSWVKRIANAHRVTLEPFLRMLSRTLGPLGDLDRGDNPGLARFLSDQTGHPLDQIEALCVFGCNSGYKLTDSLAAPRFCPLCWRVDDDPYIRWEWRCSFVPVCEIHGTDMVGRCPFCSAHFDPLASQTVIPVSHCSVCASDLRTVSPRSVSRKTTLGQIILLDMLAVAVEVQDGTAIVEMLERLQRERHQSANRFVKSRLSRLYDLAKAGEREVMKVLPGNGLERVLRATGMQGAGWPWIDRSPVPVRCWPDLDRTTPVYRDALDPIKPVYDVTLFDLLQAYATSKIRWSSII
ncbi:MAG: TniQ family protein [Alphaproteobacteria bacterium]|nr:TniQ family protein [Alphaproteobacteria bacterium]